MTYEEQVDLVRNLKGAPSSVLWILLLSGRSLTADELCIATAYSDKSVRKALAWLEPRGLVQNNGHLNGWSIGRGMRQLPLPLSLGRPSARALDVPDEPQEPAPLSENFRQSRASEHNFLGEFPTMAGDAPTEDRRISDNGAPEGGYAPTHGELSTGYPQVDGGEDRKFSDNGGEIRVASRARASDQDLIDLIDDLDQSINQSDQPDQTRARPEPVCAPTGDGRYGALLDAIGIAEPARSRIMARDAPAVVLAWWWKIGGAAWLSNPAGWLIRCLERGDRPPPAWLELASWFWSLSDEAYQALRESTWYGTGLQGYLAETGLTRAAAALAMDVLRDDECAWRTA